MDTAVADAAPVIEQGTEIPYQTASSSGATSIQFRKANLKLEVKPQITQALKQRKLQAYQEGLRKAAKTDYKFGGQ